jgi:hypothetical protein
MMLSFDTVMHRSWQMNELLGKADVPRENSVFNCHCMTRAIFNKIKTFQAIHLADYSHTIRSG